MTVAVTTKCELCGAETAKSYVCKPCGKTVCSDCLASGRFIGTKKCRSCTGISTSPTRTPSPKMEKTDSGSDRNKKGVGAPFSKITGAAKAVGHAGKTAVKGTAGAVGSVATGAVGAGTHAIGGAAHAAGAGLGKVGQFAKFGGTFDAGSGGGMLDMSDATCTKEERSETIGYFFWSVKFGWELYALLNVTIIEASGLKAADTNIIGKAAGSDPYCVVTLLSDKTSRRTQTCKKTLSPVWNHECTTIVVNVPCQKMKVQVWDWDATSDDDLIGEAVIDLTHLSPGNRTNGWVPLTHEGEPAGAVHLALEIMFTPWSEKIAFVQEEMVPRPTPKPKFDINALYGPGMWLADVLWFGWLEPIVMNQLLPIIMWQNWFKSFGALIVYMIASYYAAYWPAFACWITAGFMVRNKTLKGYERFMANKSMTSGFDKTGKLVLLEVEENDNDDVDQQEFGGLIKTFTRMSPGWVKEMAAGFQPTLKIIVEGVALARNIILWKHEFSKKVFYVLLATGVVLCFLPFWILVMAAGAGILLANSPLKGFFIGLAKYTARPKPTGDIGLLDAMEEHHHSSDYKTLVVQKQRTRTKDTTTSETTSAVGATRVSAPM